ncbi:hypothetical protein MTO96_004331 [Rhipicephalus appendiculatus]|uniref:28s ribosomal protein s36 mitochondrial n=1 Tax=Rhipicephalus zambeziensis TaxID=60191 RepID=A0A224Y0X5_9ACAR
MASSSARVIQAVKPHNPLIKFRAGSARTGRGPTQTTASSAAMKATSSATPAESKPVGSLPRGSGIDESQLPARYARKPLSQYEGDYIQRGGPE